MAFDLTKAAGFDKIVSNLDTMEITQIPIDQIDTNEKNFFSVEDVEDLKDSIAMKGILQPLLVTKAGDRYRIIAGHRRHKAAAMAAAEGNDNLLSVPCVVLPEMSEAMEWALLIQTNTTARELSYSEKMKAAQQMKSTLVQLKEEGVRITGKLRDIVAEQLEISRTELARMDVIEKNLIPEGKDLLKKGVLSASSAYAMARTKPECQKELIDQKPAAFIVKHIEDYSVRRELDYLNKDCPHPEGWWQHNEKMQGHALPCPSWKKIKAHKDKGHPERCPGCCANCTYLADCKDACDNAKHAMLASIRDQAAKKETERRKAQEAEEKKFFQTTSFAKIGKAISAVLNRGGITAEDVSFWWSDNLAELYPYNTNSVDAFSERDVWKIIHAETMADVELTLAAFVSLCDALELSPNYVLGYSDEDYSGFDLPSFTGWNDMLDFDPPDGSRVIAVREHNGSRFTGEYIYRDKAWFSADMPDMELNVNNVTHWIIAPDRR